MQKDPTLGHATAVGPDAPSRWTLDQVTMMVLHWLKQRMDAANKQGKTAHKREFSKEEKVRMLDRLCWSDHSRELNTNISTFSLTGLKTR